MILAAQDFGCLPSQIEDELTDLQWSVWLEMKIQEAKAAEKAAKPAGSKP